MTRAKKIQKTLTPRLGTRRSRALLSVAVAASATSCAGSGTSADPPASRPAIAITVLTSPGCAATDPAVAQLKSIAARLGVDLNLERTLVETGADASRLHFFGSPTILVEHQDLDFSARGRTDFGLG
jgi:hypothetical protein